MSLSLEERQTLKAAREIKARERQERKKARPKPVIPTAEGQRRPRKRDNGYLAWLRRQPCAVRGAHGLGCSGPVQAAHIRTPRPGEPPTGLQRKPNDDRATPLCAGHHAQQHGMSEMRFWSRFGIDPHALADRLYATFKGETA
jgi:hypothetical protein